MYGNYQYFQISNLLSGGKAEWLTYWTSNHLMNASCMGSNHIRGKLLFPSAKNTHCLVMVGSRNGFKSVFISFKLSYTIKIKKKLYIPNLCIIYLLWILKKQMWFINTLTIFPSLNGIFIIFSPKSSSTCICTVSNYLWSFVKQEPQLISH
jgi:hypothetical protein